jgi:hypothetical protein
MARLRAGNLHAPQRGSTNPYEFAIAVVADALDGLTQSLDAYTFGARRAAFAIAAAARSWRPAAAAIVRA